MAWSLLEMGLLGLFVFANTEWWDLLAGLTSLAAGNEGIRKLDREIWLHWFG